MLCTVDDLLAIPGMSNSAAVPLAFLNNIIGAADSQIKDYCKQNLEMAYYTQFYSGNTVRDIIARQFPLWTSQALLDPSMAGVALPPVGGNIVVNSTRGFHPGLGGANWSNPNTASELDPPGIAVQTGINSYSYVQYTGTTPTSFTGCTGGTGNMSGAPNNRVFSPVIWYDPSGYGGQKPGGFADGTMMVMGTQFMVVTDVSPYRSVRGTVRRQGGAGAAFVGLYPEILYQGKLAAYGLPDWPRGDKNIKMAWAAGYSSTDRERRSLAYCCAMLAAQMVRIMPTGANLQSESLGSYSYSLLVNSDNPEMAEVRRVLAPFREVSLPGGIE